MRFVTLFEHLKDIVARDLGLSHPMLHLHVGLLIFLAAACLARSLASPIPLVAVAGAEGLNELLDRAAFGSWRIPDTAADIVNSLLWPTILFVVARWVASGRRARR